MVSPDGAVHILDLPAGPPLGLGGLPFETVETELPEGSVLALYTDGLLEARDHDIDEALDRCSHALARPAAPWTRSATASSTRLLTHRPDDDVALLLARTRALQRRPGRHLGPARRPRRRRPGPPDATDQLAAWGLDDAAFTTELVVSELVTNAIRYGQPPIRLRLIHETAP